LRIVFDTNLLGVLARKFSRDAEELAHVAVFLGAITSDARKFGG